MAISYRYKINGGIWSALQTNQQSCNERPSVNQVNSKIEFDQITVPAGEVFHYWQYPLINFEGTPVGFSVNGPVTNAASGEIILKTGSSSDIGRYGNCSVGVCVENSECPEGYHCVDGECIPIQCYEITDCGPCEKCVDGDCVPCEDCRDGQGSLILYGWNIGLGDFVDTIPVDFTQVEILNIPIPTPVQYIYGWRVTCPKGFNNGNIILTEHYDYFPLGDAPEINREIAVYENKQFADIAVNSYGYWTELLAVGPRLTQFANKVSLTINISGSWGVCADDVEPAPVDPVFPPIVEPPPTEPVTPPEEPPEILEIDEPLPLDPVTQTGGGEPSEPQSGCECEIYAAKTILAGLQQVRNSILSHQNAIDARLADGDRILHGHMHNLENIVNQQWTQQNKLIYQLSQWFGNAFFTEIMKQREAIETGLIRDELGLIDGIIGPDGKTLVQAVQEIEPVLIENEFRVESRRLPDVRDDL